jgi:hypothetical protein
VRTPSEKYHEHDQSRANKNVQHKEALRLALGSILTPVRTNTVDNFAICILPFRHLLPLKKRSFTPSSRSSSGTASPAHPASFAPSPPQSIPSHGTDAGRADALLHPRNPFFPHTPSRLGHSVSDAFAQLQDDLTIYTRNQVTIRYRARLDRLRRLCSQPSHMGHLRLLFWRYLSLQCPTALKRVKDKYTQYALPNRSLLRYLGLLLPPLRPNRQDVQDRGQAPRKPSSSRLCSPRAHGMH